jgi:hypothetical protein
MSERSDRGKGAEMAKNVKRNRNRGRPLSPKDSEVWEALTAGRLATAFILDSFWTEPAQEMHAGRGGVRLIERASRRPCLSGCHEFLACIRRASWLEASGLERRRASPSFVYQGLIKIYEI